MLQSVSIHSLLSSVVISFCLGISIPLGYAETAPDKGQENIQAVKSINPQPNWKEIAPDFEVVELSTTDGGIFSASLLFARTKLDKFRVKVVRAKEYGSNRSTVKSIANSSGAVLAINSNFFDPNGEPLGLIVSRGISLNPIHKGGKVLTGIFQVTNNGISIINRGAFQVDGILEATQAGPRLLSSGNPVQGLKQSQVASRRAGVCIDAQDRLIFFCSRSTFGGVTMSELQRILTDSRINCVDALNLDGGGSAQLYISVKDQNDSLVYEQSIAGRDPVPTALILQEIR